VTSRCLAARILDWSVAAVLWFLITSAPSAHAFVTYANQSGQLLRWKLSVPSSFVHTNVVNRNTKAIRYFVASDLYSQANRTAELNAVRACFGQWESVPNTILKFEEGGMIGAGADINTADNTNVVFWTKGTTLVNGGRDDISGLRGYTLVAFADDNTLLEADIVLNAFDHQWFADVNDSVNAGQFIEATLLHEIGHLIGLDHSPVGAATVTIGAPGVSTEAGLSADEVAAAQWLYSPASFLATLGAIRGRVIMNGVGVFGAMVTAENSAGNVAAGTVTRVNGGYELPALPPGNYLVRASPLDPSNVDVTASLMRGPDIAPDYEAVVTAFHAASNRPVTVTAGANANLDFNVTAGNPPFRITGISAAADHPDADTADRYATSVRQGQRNLFVGVSSTTLPTSGATLSVTGDGLTVGPTTFEPLRFQDGRHLLSVQISVASNATPGLRTFVVQQGNNFAYANGYLEVLPPFSDFNFDGFDDAFQRRFFPLFTAPEAKPEADPDQDGFNNRYEHETGTDPTNPRSAQFAIESVKLTSAGTAVMWRSAPGKRYQLFSRSDLSNSSWQAAGPPVTASASTMQAVDALATNVIRFYRVQQLPNSSP